MRFIFFFLFIVTLVSCNLSGEFPEAEIGDDFVEVSSKAYFIDTLSFELGTFKFDSIIVSNSPRLLIGNYFDETFGTVKSKSFIQLSDFDFFIDNDATYDSIAFVLDYDRYFYNDTIASQKYSVYQVTEDIEPSEDNFYYNTNKFNYDPTAIGEINFTPKPRGNDSLFIKLNDVYGREIFEDIQQENITNTGDFIDKYKGLLIEGGVTNSAILGFKNNSFLRIYYTLKDELENEDLVFDIPTSTENTFNNTSNDFTGTPFTNIKDQETIITSSESNNNSFIQNGLGILTRVEIKNIKSLYNIPGDGVLLDARLKLNIKKKTNTDNRPVRDSLGVFIINNKSVVLETLTSSTSQVFGRINTEEEEFDIITYEFFILPFLNQLLDTQTNEKLFLAIHGQDITSSVDRYIFYGENRKDELRAKLEVLYVVYDE